MLKAIFQYIIIFPQDLMTNPYASFAADDDEEDYKTVGVEHKPKRTHAQKRVFKQGQQAMNQATSFGSSNITEQLPERHKDDIKQVRNPRHPPTPLTKQLGEGHFHDKRSGTGRPDKVRKAGGGKGNVGNVKDDLNQDRYIGKEEASGNAADETKGEEIEEVKPEEPQALTLQEYYKNKGVDIQNTFEQKQVKKGQVKAEWIKKEKLTVMETKEDKKQNDKKIQNVVKFSDTRGEADEKLQILGFHSKPSKQSEERREAKPDQRAKGGKGRKDKVNLKEDDFPTL